MTSTLNSYNQRGTDLPKEEVFIDDLSYFFVSPYVTVKDLTSELLIVLDVDEYPTVLASAGVPRGLKRSAKDEINWGSEEIFQALPLRWHTYNFKKSHQASVADACELYKEAK